MFTVLKAMILIPVLKSFKGFEAYGLMMNNAMFLKTIYLSGKIHYKYLLFRILFCLCCV